MDGQSQPEIDPYENQANHGENPGVEADTVTDELEAMRHDPIYKTAAMRIQDETGKHKTVWIKDIAEIIRDPRNRTKVVLALGAAGTVAVLVGSILHARHQVRFDKPKPKTHMQ